MTELAPCPFCGASDAFAEREDFTAAYVTCNHCSARGPVECQESDDEETPGKSAAELSWNTRINRSSQPKYFTGCLRDGVCRGVCENKGCPNHDMVVAARLVVEPKQDGIAYPEKEAFRLNPDNRQQKGY